MICEIYHLDNGEAKRVALVTLTGDKVSATSTEHGSDVIVKNLLAGTHYTDDGERVSLDKDPVKWFETLPDTYSGTYMWAEMGPDVSASKDSLAAKLKLIQSRMDGLEATDPGHAGRPGQRGGSLPGHGGPAEQDTRNDEEQERLMSPDEYRTTFQQLKGRWATINNELLNYLDDPKAPKVQELMNHMRDVAHEINQLRDQTPSSGAVSKSSAVKDLVIVGAGPGGLATAIMGAADGLSSVFVDANKTVGGQAKYSSRIENYPGFPAGVTGSQLADTMYTQATRLGAEDKLGVRATGLEYDPNTGIKTVTLSTGEKIRAKAVVLAGGVEFNKLNFPGSDSHDVIYADGEALQQRYAGKNIVVLGGSNGAAQAALGAARTANHVYMISRSPIEKSMSDYQVLAVRNHPKIDVIENDSISKATLDDHQHVTGVETAGGKKFEANGIGVFVGSAPKTEWLPAGIDRVEGKIKTDINLETSMPGVFAIGDMRIGSIGRIGAAVGDGQMAERNIFQYFERTSHHVHAAADVDFDELIDKLFDLDAQYPEPLTQSVEIEAHADDTPSADIKKQRHDLPITIEHPKGTDRVLHDDEGNEVYRKRMHNDYGFFDGTKGRDGDEVDCFLGPDEHADSVYIIHMKDLGPVPDEREDEDKCFIGFDSGEAAKEAFFKHYPRTFFGGMTELTVEDFKERLATASLPHRRKKITASDPGHAGRPGQRGGSAPGKADRSLPRETIPANSYSMSPEEHAVEDRFADHILKDPKAAIAQYRSKFGNVVSADNAKELSEDYRNNRAYANAVHEPSTWLAKQVYAEMLKEPVPDDKFNVVFITSGMAGAGKTSAIGSDSAVSNFIKGAQIVYDGSTSHLPKIAKQALDAGKNVVVGYIYRDPVDAFKNGILTRAKETGRTVGVWPAVDMHLSSQFAVSKLANEYKSDPRVQVVAIDNSRGFGKAQVVPLDQIPKADASHRDSLGQTLYNVLEEEHKSGRVSDDIYKAVKNPQTKS